MKFGWKNCFRICVSVFLLFLAMTYWELVAGILMTILGASTPIFIGFAIAYVLNLLMSFYEKHYFPKKREPKRNKKPSKLNFSKFIDGSRRPVCLVASILTLLVIIAVVVWIVIPELVQAVSFLVSEIPPLISKLLNTEFVQKALAPETIDQLRAIDWKTYITKIAETLGSGLGSAVDVVFSAISSVISALVTVFISIIFAVYMLTSKEGMLHQSKRLLKNYLKPSWVNKILHFFDVLNSSFRNYVVGQCTEAIILGLLCIIGMAIFQFPYAMMVGTLIGFTALIPVAGAYIGAAVGCIMILTVSPIKALLFLVFIVVLQQLEGNIIYPKVVGSSLGLPAMWVLAAVTIGGGLMGVLGMLLGVPVVATIYRLVCEDMEKRESNVSES